MAAEMGRDVLLRPRAAGADRVLQARRGDDLEEELLLPIERAGADAVHAAAV